MHAKKTVNHRGGGHATREKAYEDTTATTDVMAFMMGRVPQPIESLKCVSSMRVPELSKYTKYSDVPKKDPAQKLIKESAELKAYAKATHAYEATLVSEPTNEEAQARLLLLIKERTRLEEHLRRRVLHNKQTAVFEQGVLEHETMPLDELRKLYEVNSYEGITLTTLVLHYGLGKELDFEVDKIIAERCVGKGKYRTIEYLVVWKGYKQSRASWLSCDAVGDDVIAEYTKSLKSVADHSAKAMPLSPSPRSPHTGAASPHNLWTPGAKGRNAPQLNEDRLAAGRKAAQLEEDRLAAKCQELVQSGKKKGVALVELAVQMGDMAISTLKKKVLRAERRMKVEAADVRS